MADPVSAQVEAARAEQAIVAGILRAEDDMEGTSHAAAYEAMCGDHWRLIQRYEPQRIGLGVVADPVNTDARAAVLADHGFSDRYIADVLARMDTADVSAGIYRVRITEHAKAKEGNRD